MIASRFGGRERIHDLLPTDGTERKWSDLLRAAREKGYSSATLAKYANLFVEEGTWRREERYRGRLREVFYSSTERSAHEMKLLEASRSPTLPFSADLLRSRLLKALELEDKQDLDKWTGSENSVADTLLIELSMIAWHVGRVIEEACKKRSLAQAKKYLQDAIQMQLKSSLQSALEKCYPFRASKHNVGTPKQPNFVPIMGLVNETFFCMAEEAGFKMGEGG